MLSEYFLGDPTNGPFNEFPEILVKCQDFIIPEQDLSPSSPDQSLTQ